ncbi:hypothetical protein BD779DRAFT_1803847 [Infundibulicybe gibba]|nr:hypothetical protein BD779DRAFT_1803847 [Infundibulicybe gibba]
MSSDQRIAKLNKLFHSILSGGRVVSVNQKDLFLEAICAQPDPVDCIHKLQDSPVGLPSLQAAMRFDLDTTFLNGRAAALIKFLQHPQMDEIDGGKLLEKILLSIVEPPLFWSAFCRAFRSGILEDDGQESFAWLLLQLVSLPGGSAEPYTPLAEDQQVMNQILTSNIPNVRMIGSKIKHVLDVTTVAVPKGEFSPGGRHDNDFVDFREVSILPTADEIISNEPPFLRPSESMEDPATFENRVTIYLDNQFRLLREDMLGEMREELHIALGRKKGYHRGLVIEKLKVLKIHCGPEGRRRKWGIAFQMSADLPQLKKIKPHNRKAFFADHRRIFMHQSLTSLLVDNEIVAFPTIDRDEELLARNPPIIILQFEGETSTRKSLTKLKLAQNIKLIQIDTAMFAFEPILRAIQRTRVLPLSQELLFWSDGTIPSEVDSPPSLVSAVLRNPQQELRTLLGTTTSVRLDKSQAMSLVAGLTQKVSLIQGPPGTGKSFIGALLAKALHDTTSKTILVVCYTNHALDQFLEDLLKIGIPASSMVRLGGKSTPLTEPLSLFNQPSNYRLQRSDWTTIDALKALSEQYRNKLEAGFSRYISSKITPDQLLNHLESKDPAYFEAFRVPNNADDMTRRLGCWDFKQETHIQQATDIWSMSPAQRRERVDIWKRDLFEEQINDLCSTAKQYNTTQMELSRKFSQRDTAKLQQKRIIGCTTTAAAKYCEDIQAASPSVLLVEEAGEILESHIITALGRDKDQLILIGDHKQLRPKINSYKLSVEKGEGYDLNRSLFERLVLKGYPHETLSQQHRMRPEISALIRELTYPDLTDAADTQDRPNLCGVTDNIVLIDHQHPEDDMPRISDRNDLSTSSKQNTHEAEMVLKIVRYLAQQGYGTDKLVILTPYLGQLRNLAESLKKDNDPILNDLDSSDLVKAGLLPAATAQVTKNPIRIATIGEYRVDAPLESEIVIVSLTRSNSNHDIGFMFSPERLNVLLSRARNALIMIGNTETFSKSRKGGEIWNKLFGLLKKAGHVYDGLPVACGRHQDRKALLREPNDFDSECPDGGCKEPCGTKLNCGLHDCPSKCHQIYDHSKMPCEFLMQSKCDQGHNKTWKCNKSPPLTCLKCEGEARLREKKAKEAIQLQQQREVEELAHAARLAEVEQKIQAEKQNLCDAQIAEERRQAIQQKEANLQDTTSITASASSRTANATSAVDASASSLFSLPPEGSRGSPWFPPVLGSPDAPRQSTATPLNPWNSGPPFHFGNFNGSEPLEILNHKQGDQHLPATEPAEAVAIQVLDQQRNRLNFGSADTAENIFSQSDSINVVSEPQEFDPNHDRDAHAASNLDRGEDVVKCMKDMLDERWERGKKTSIPRSHQGMVQMPGPRSQSLLPETSITTTTRTDVAPPTLSKAPSLPATINAGRDPGVSDQLRLQSAIQAAKNQATRKREEAARLQQAVEEAAKRELVTSPGKLIGIWGAIKRGLNL